MFKNDNTANSPDIDSTGSNCCDYTLDEFESDDDIETEDPGAVYDVCSECFFTCHPTLPGS